MPLRPIVRSFKKDYSKEAAAWVRAGGHAFVWETEKKCLLVFQAPPDDKPEDFGAWAVYDFGKSQWDIHHVGIFKGLATTTVPKDCHWIAKRRTERDSIHRGPTRRVSFDCTKCAACCLDNEVYLLTDDIARLKEHGYGYLTKKPYIRRHKDGRILLTLLRNKRCRQLQDDNRCGIYEARPFACSEFPMGSECCLYAREEMKKLYDGVPPEG